MKPARLGTLMVSAGLAAWFSWHALEGTRGLERQRALEQDIAQLQAENAELVARRTVLEARVRAMRPGSIDPDLLDEEIRRQLGLVRKDELVLRMPR